MTTFEPTPITDTPLERSITRALEQPQPVTVPADFAARVAARAVAMPQRKLASQARYGRAVTLVAASLLVVALFAIAPFADPKLTSAGFLAEMVVLLQLCALAYWFSRARREVF